MSDEYTPTTREIRESVSNDYIDGRLGEAEFDRWLAAHDAALLAEFRELLAQRVAMEAMFEPTCEEDIGYYDGRMEAARIIRSYAATEGD